MFYFKWQLIQPLDGYYARYRKHLATEANAKNPVVEQFEIKENTNTGHTNVGYHDDDDPIKNKKSYATFSNENRNLIFNIM